MHQVARRPLVGPQEEMAAWVRAIVMEAEVEVVLREAMAETEAEEEEEV